MVNVLAIIENWVIISHIRSTGYLLIDYIAIFILLSPPKYNYITSYIIIFIETDNEYIAAL